MRTTDDKEMLLQCSICQAMLIDFIEESKMDDNMAVNAMLALSFGRILQYVDSTEKLREGVIVLLENFIDKVSGEDYV